MAHTNNPSWKKLYPSEPVLIPALKVGAWSGESLFIQCQFPPDCLLGATHASRNKRLHFIHHTECIHCPSGLEKRARCMVHFCTIRKSVFNSSISSSRCCISYAIDPFESNLTTSVTGASGLLVGGIGGIVRSSTPGLFAIASGLQWAALGTTYYGEQVIISQ